MRIRHLRLHHLVILTLLLAMLTSIYAAASPELQLTLGFDEQIMRHRFAPFRIQVTGLAESIEGKLVVTQTRGVPGTRQAPISHTIETGVLSNGIYDATLPLAEPLNPITVELISHDGTILAAHQHSARLGIREWPFPVIVGDPLQVDRTEAIVDVSELPTDWWAYDSVESVWLLSPIVTAPVLETLGEWVVSGGSLVLFTGAEFPRMDSPVFRKLLPLTTPVLNDQDDGSYRLEGVLRDQASASIFRDDDPILIQMPLGAGTISLVTLRVDDLTVEEFDQLVEQIDVSIRMPSIEQLTLATLRQTSVPRPPFWITGVLVVLILVILFLFTDTPHRLRNNRTFVALGIAILFLAVSSGLYANRNNAFILLYQANTSIRVLSSFGLDIDLWTLYATQVTDIALDHAEGSYPLPSVLPTTTSVNFAEANSPDRTTLSLQRNERRDLTFFDQGRLDVTLEMTPDSAEITNRTDSDLGGAYILFGNETYAIANLEIGVHTYALESSHLPGETSALLLALQNWYPLRDGSSAWLLLIDQDEEKTLEDEGMHKKVRHVAVSLIEGGTR